jgi:hypothetical protein
MIHHDHLWKAQTGLHTNEVVNSLTSMLASVRRAGTSPSCVTTVREALRSDQNASKIRHSTSHCHRQSRTRPARHATMPIEG